MSLDKREGPSSRFLRCGRSAALVLCAASFPLPVTLDPCFAEERREGNSIVYCLSMYFDVYKMLKCIHPLVFLFYTFPCAEKDPLFFPEYFVDYYVEGGEEKEGGEGDFVASSNFSSLPLLTASEVLPPPPFSPPPPPRGQI